MSMDIIGGKHNTALNPFSDVNIFKVALPGAALRRRLSIVTSGTK